ncbi:hypothetical protein BBF96_11850 [Anoxybacter fermentans]|uniref:CRISPR-associated protein Csx11 n=1 Tax=Anoxybacter fermentans TaxID=1323375 RepID=A0A3S9T092_9FIRM|nr:hypothetical protein [Anoxybacter fermentans]AZR74026.1 hypothetical protein BBF96_11850 [Anoxybacter fermentans]
MKDFIAELHDIGKLVHDDVKNQVKDKIKDKVKGKVDAKAWKGHVFVDFPFSEFGFEISKDPSPSWWGQYHHYKLNKVSIDEIDINEWNQLSIPEEYIQDVFLLKLADHLASSISRVVEKVLDSNDVLKNNGVLKLWNKKPQKNWAAFNDINDLKVLFDEIQNCDSGDDFLEKYRKNLLLTPEDKSFPRNVTTLYTHVELVGKIYRVLKKYSTLICDENGLISIKFDEKELKTVNEAERGNKSWEAKIVKCWIKFPHSFVRLRDINLLRKRDELLKKVKERYNDEILFSTSDFLTLFVPKSINLKEIFKDFLDWGFYVEVIEIIANLGKLDSILDRKIFKARKQEKKNENQKAEISNNTKVYKKYFQQILPDKIMPICDICQQNYVIEKRDENKEDIKEWVCEKCKSIRKYGEPFREYGEIWDKEGVKVCWFKFSLDQKKLENWLQKAFNDYIRDYPDYVKEFVESELEKIENELQSRNEELRKVLEKKDELKKKVKKSNDENERRMIGLEINKQRVLRKEIQEKIDELENNKKNLKTKLVINFDYKDFQENFRPLALQMDFINDYKELLKEFWEKFGDENDIKRPISDYNELGVFKFTPELLRKVIDSYIDLFDKYFPDCIGDQTCPISFSLSISNIKYPIREHWRYFESEDKSFINIQYYPVFEEKYAKKEVEEIKTKLINSNVSQSYLYNLIQMSESLKALKSDVYVMIKILENRDKYKEPYELYVQGINPSKFLNLYRILKGAKDNE